MDLLKQFHLARVSFEKKFLGLPYPYITLIHRLLLMIDLRTGLIENITYHQIAKLMSIEQAPGRKKSGTPSKQTIRNYLKAIERAYPDDFQIISEGQSLKMAFYTFPRLNPSLFNQLQTT
jgi:hypothetical protein